MPLWHTRDCKCNQCGNYRLWRAHQYDQGLPCAKDCQCERCQQSRIRHQPAHGHGPADLLIGIVVGVVGLFLLRWAMTEYYAAHCVSVAGAWVC